MRIIVKPEEFRFPIPILFPSVLIFNHITAILGLVVLLTARTCGAKWSKSLPLSPWNCFWDVSSADYRVLDHALPHSRMEDGGSGLAGCARDDKTVIPSANFPKSLAMRAVLW